MSKSLTLNTGNNSKCNTTKVNKIKHYNEKFDKTKVYRIKTINTKIIKPKFLAKITTISGINSKQAIRIK